MRLWCSINSMKQVLYKACTYSIDDFNAKIKAAGLEQMKNWEFKLKI